MRAAITTSGRRRAALEHGAIGAGEVRGDERALILGSEQIAGRIDDGRAMSSCPALSASKLGA